MNSQTFSSVERKGPVSLTATAAVVMLGSIAALPPLSYNSIYAKSAYSIGERQISSGGFMNFINRKESTHSSIDSDLVPNCFKDLSDAESFAMPLVQGLQFIQKIAFIESDDAVDKELNAHFSARIGKTNKLFVNPYNKQV